MNPRGGSRGGRTNRGTRADRVANAADRRGGRPEGLGGDIVEGFKKKYNDDFYVMASYTGIAMLANVDVVAAKLRAILSQLVPWVRGRYQPECASVVQS